jgi:hypothetical protein
MIQFFDVADDHKLGDALHRDGKNRLLPSLKRKARNQRKNSGVKPERHSHIHQLRQGDGIIPACTTQNPL